MYRGFIVLYDLRRVDPSSVELLRLGEEMCRGFIFLYDHTIDIDQPEACSAID
ncbi:MAG TPA: hypothetical protein QGH10_27725 [Armatimonadota bacterium]|nr:hypothetical protein [Armatimonadota bacterium]